MASNVSTINALMTGNISDAHVGATNSGTVSTDSGFTASEFQGQLDRVMQQDSGMESASEVSSASETASDVSTVVETTDEGNCVAEDTGDSLSGDISTQAQASSSTQTEAASSATSQKPNLSTVEQSTEMSTVDKSRFAVRTTQQKISDIEDALENGSGTEFLTELKNLLLSLCDCDLENLSLDEDGLEALGNLLVQAGFDSASVEELISDLTLNLEAEDDLVSVSDFMDDLFELPLAEGEDITQADTLMPSSDLPYIKSLLSMMGVDDQEITSIMDSASEGTQGFDFDTFIEQLEQLLDTAGESGLTYQADAGDDAYTKLLEQLGLDSFIEESDTPLTLSTLIDAFAEKLDQKIDQTIDLIDNNSADQAGQADQLFSDMFTTQSSDALATESGRQGLLNQLFLGLNIEQNSEQAVDSAVTVSANSESLIKEIEDRFQGQFIDQINRRGANTINDADGQVTRNTISADLQTEAINADNAINAAHSFSDTSGTTRESASQLSIKAAQADAAALEKMTSTTNVQTGDTTSKSSETQNFVFGVEKSTTTVTVGNSGTQRTQQAFSTLPDFVTRQVGKSIARSISTGSDTIQMQLKPSELGKVFMSIEHNGDSMKVSVITEHQSAKDMLAANVHEIKAMLSSSGVNLESFEVDMSSDFQQSMADARARDQSAGKRQAKGRSGNDAQEDVVDNLSAQTSVANDSGALHFVA